MLEEKLEETANPGYDHDAETEQTHLIIHITQGVVDTNFCIHVIWKSMTVLPGYDHDAETEQTHLIIHITQGVLDTNFCIHVIWKSMTVFTWL